MKESKKKYYRIVFKHKSFLEHKYVVQYKRKRGLLKFWWFDTEIGWDSLEEAREDRDDMIDIDNGVYDDMINKLRGEKIIE